MVPFFLPHGVHTYIHTHLYSAKNRENESEALYIHSIE